MTEIWKDVVGYEDFFKISNIGRVYSKRSNKILKTRKNRYETFTTRLNGRDSKMLSFRVHRLVAIAFIDNPDNKPDVNHIDGNKINNNVDNLEWVTKSENVVHAMKTKLLTFESVSGENSRTAKITWEIARNIRKIKNDDPKLTCADISAMINVDKQIIKRVISNTCWKE